MANLGQQAHHDAQALGRLTSAVGEPPGRLTPTEDLRAVVESEGDVARPGGFGGGRARARGRSPLVREQTADDLAAEPLTFLDTLNITRPAWLAEVGEKTRDHREAKARDLEGKALTRTRAARLDGHYEHTAKEKGAWHRARAHGQRNRISTVSDCCETTVIIACQGCGVIREKPGRCRVGLLCLSCRGKIAAEKRGQFMRARASVRKDARGTGLLYSSRRGGRYSEKLLTLTVPHDRGHTVRARIDLARRAWSFFLKRFNKWLRAHHADKHAHWFRTFEWTPGDDGRGHPHFHVWLFSPYLPHEELRSTWFAALRAAGLMTTQPPIVDVRAVTDGAGAAAEVIKYLTKDVVANGDLVAPLAFAEVYKALDGTRATQASRGFMARAHREPQRCECGASGCLRAVIRKVNDAGHTAGYSEVRLRLRPGTGEGTALDTTQVTEEQKTGHVSAS